MQLSLRITLPNGFPDISPIIVVSPPVVQRWVGQDMKVVGHESIVSWNRNCSLGKIIKDIEIEFNLRPPTAILSPSPATIPREDIPFPEVELLRFPIP